MSMESRLVDALRRTEEVEPSGDLWSRVVHSIEEDQVHRRRVIKAVGTTIGALLVLIALGVLATTDGPIGRQVRLPAMELLETTALVVLVVVLGPAIRRFGRGYADDLWPATPTTATALLRLLDVAYVLVFTGFILMTAELDVGTSPVLVAEQIQSACERIGGLVLIMGVLHGATIVVLPVVALISNSTRVGRALPKWLVMILVVAGAGLGMQAALAVVGLLAGAS